MTDTEDFVEVVASDVDKIDISDHVLGDSKVATVEDPGDNHMAEFLEIYERIRVHYGDTLGLRTPGTLPHVDEITKLYKGVNLNQEVVVKRRWTVASELALLDVIVRDMVAIQKYLDSTEDQQYLTRAVDHFTKDKCEDKWDTSRWAFVVAYKGNEDKYDMGKTGFYEDELFHYRFCRDFTFAELFISKFSNDDLVHVLLAPLKADAFSSP